MVRIMTVISKWFWVIRRVYRGRLRSIIWVVFLLMVGSLCQSISPLIGKAIFDKALIIQNYELLVKLGLVWIVILFTVVLLKYIANLQITQIETSVCARLKALLSKALFNELFLKGVSVTKTNGEMLSRLLVDTGKFITNAGLSPVLHSIISFITFCIPAFITLKLDWVMGITCILTSIITVVIQHKAPSVLSKKNRELSNVRADTSSKISNSLAAWKSVVRHNTISKEAKFIYEACLDQADSEYSAHKANETVVLKVSLITTILPIILIWIGAYRIFKSYISIGTLIAFCSYLPMMTSSATSVLGAGLSFFIGLGQSDELINILREHIPETEVAKMSYANKSPLKTLVIEKLNIIAGSFSLTSNKLEFHGGRTYLLKGDSGTGKSVFLEFLAGIRKPESAEVFRNNTLLCLESFMDEAKTFGYLIKDDILFDASVLENMSYGSIDGKSTFKNIESVAALLSIEKKVHDTTKGLSEGEKQRISFVREILRNPEVFIIDEGLDSIQLDIRDKAFRLLRESSPKSILIICSHNWKNFIDIDSTIDIMDGRIVQSNIRKKAISSS